MPHIELFKRYLFFFHILFFKEWHSLTSELNLLFTWNVLKACYRHLRLVKCTHLGGVTALNRLNLTNSLFTKNVLKVCCRHKVHTVRVNLRQVIFSQISFLTFGVLYWSRERQSTLSHYPYESALFAEWIRSEGVYGCWKSKKIASIFEGAIALMIKPVIISRGSSCHQRQLRGAIVK